MGRVPDRAAPGRRSDPGYPVLPGHRISPADPPWPEQDRRTGAGLRRGCRPGLDLFPGHHRLRLHAGRRPASENDRPEQYPVLALSQQFAPELAGPVKMA